MSFAVITYRCEQCEFETGNLHTWGSREYVLPSGIRIPMDWTLGWCSDCDNVSAVEVLDAAERQREVDHAAKDLNSLGPRPTAHSDEQSLANWNYLAGLLADALDALRIVTDRIGALRCLKCGSRLVEPWQAKTGDNMLPVHGPCGGSMLALEDGLRIALQPTITRYTAEGEFIEQIEVAGYSSPDWEYFADRSEQNARIRGLWTSTKANNAATPLGEWPSSRNQA